MRTPPEFLDSIIGVYGRSPGRIVRQPPSFIQKEKPHVVGNHRCTDSPEAAGLFRRQNQSKVPINRRLDPYADRYRHHIGYSEPVAHHIDRIIS